MNCQIDTKHEEHRQLKSESQHTRNETKMEGKVFEHIYIKHETQDDVESTSENITCEIKMEADVSEDECEYKTCLSQDVRSTSEVEEVEESLDKFSEDGEMQSQVNFNVFSGIKHNSYEPNVLLLEEENFTGKNSFKCNEQSDSLSFSETIVNLNKFTIEKSCEKTFQCNICCKLFSQKRYLAAHVPFHSSEKPFKCEICTKSFYHKGALNRHKRIHTNERHFKCLVCTKSFSRKCSLSTHLQLHSEEKSFKCHVCGKSFQQRGGLTIHLHTHEDDKSFQCNICSKTFSQKSYLKRHLFVHSREKPVKN